ncbi:hypothetical protein B9Z19DRAFT_653447 [Tuber borchii]|uniref:Uncharacterized protein n=1 Tax=Tuber borchii TaxID=42251 RepID=A0A2T7A071_TUBBO|nr:hypothetical protein B9Z19DRAFT_653447 [Tuber borchii]
MSGRPHEGIPERAASTRISSSEGKLLFIKAPILPDPAKLPPAPAPSNTSPSLFSHVISSCSSVSEGECPRLYGWTGDEKEAWLNLYEMGNERLLAALSITPLPQPQSQGCARSKQSSPCRYIIKVIENNTAEEERRSRIAEFELRARRMGITDENLVAQKVAIWEGIRAAEQNGDSIGVSTLCPFPFGGYSWIVTGWSWGLIAIQYHAGILLDAATSVNQ